MARLRYNLPSYRRELHSDLGLLIHGPAPQDPVNALGAVRPRHGLQVKLPQDLGKEHPDLPPGDLFARTHPRALAERLEPCPVIVREFRIE